MKPSDSPAPPPSPPLREGHHGYLGARIALIVVALVAACGLPATTSKTEISTAGARTVAQGRTFYVAPWGRDRYRGTSSRYPWRTVWRVDHAHLHAGDRVLFRGGETFADDTLMPGYGVTVSGVAGAPVRFGSYGRGRATLTRGIWLGRNARYPHGPSHLVFSDLALGPTHGFQGTGDYISLLRLKITDIVHGNSQDETGIETVGSHWVIADNRIDRTGDSGMLLGFDANLPGEPAGGSDYAVYGNLINHTGLDPAINYGTHGIYLKVDNAMVARNRILNFRNNGVSVRYRNARIVNNYIANGSIGIAWFQYDTTPGVSSFIRNTIVNTTAAAIFVCGASDTCQQPLEAFVIRGNRLRMVHGAAMNLQPSSGKYTVNDNR